MAEKKPVQVQQRMRKLVVPCDKWSNHMFGIPDDLFADMLRQGEYAECKEFVGKDKGAVITRYWLQNAEDYTGMKPLEPFHREVLYLLIAAYEQGFRYASFSMTLDGLTGGTEKRHVYSEQFAAIEEAIKKLAGTIVTADLTPLLEAVPAYRKRYKGSFKLSGQILPCRFVEAELNGQKTIAVELFAESPLMTVAKAKQQLLTYDAAPLAIPGQRNTERVMTIKGWLLRRIESAKAGRLNRSILFKTLYEECGLADASKWQKQDARKIIVETLNAFKTSQVIKDYEIVRDGNRYRSITLSYDKSEKS